MTDNGDNGAEDNGAGDNGAGESGDGKVESDAGGALLAGAYALETPDQHVTYYRDFAAHYDDVFAGGLGYVYPLAIAAALADMPRPPGRILDVGCGTGLVAAAIHDRQPDAEIDGVDISPEMIAKAADKGAYASLIVADLTADFSHLPAGYASIVSAGTFTHGHLGPEPLVRLISHCVAGAVAAIGVNSLHFEAQGFRRHLDRLVDAGRISEPILTEVPIYDGRSAEHSGDTAFVLTFRVI